MSLKLAAFILDPLGPLGHKAPLEVFNASALPITPLPIEGKAEKKYNARVLKQ